LTLSQHQIEHLKLLPEENGPEEASKDKVNSAGKVFSACIEFKYEYWIIDTRVNH